MRIRVFPPSITPPRISSETTIGVHTAIRMR